MPEHDDCRKYLATLIEGIQLLAAEFETQCNVLPEFVHIPDEVLMEYGDNFFLAEQVLEAGLISEAQYTKMQELDYALDTIPAYSNYEVALEAMRNGAEWETLRVKARKVLEILGVEKRTPDLSQDIYIGGPQSNPWTSRARHYLENLTSTVNLDNLISRIQERFRNSWQVD